MIRDSVFDDFLDVLPLLKQAHANTQYKHTTFDQAHVQRQWAGACSLPNYFCKVTIDENEKIIGVLGAAVVKNTWGALIGVDLICYSKRDTPRLLREFIEWSRAKGAEAICLQNISGNERYDRLLKAIGFKHDGHVYMRGI